MKKAGPFRRDLIERAGGKCEWCGHSFSNPNPSLPREMSVVSAHEILNGPLRSKTLMEPCSLLILDFTCNAGDFNRKQLWPMVRQIALLKIRRPQDFDLERFLWLRNPAADRFITHEEVEEWIPSLLKSLSERGL